MTSLLFQYSKIVTSYDVGLINQTPTKSILSNIICGGLDERSPYKNQIHAGLNKGPCIELNGADN
jgi:hypothetical protein